MYVGILQTLLTPLVQYLFIAHLNWGYIGFALGRASLELISMISLLLYVYISGCCKEAFRLPNKSVLKDLGPMLKIGVSAALMLSFESWGY